MGKLFLILLLAGLGWYAYNNGLYYNLTHDLEPEPQRTCEVCGPVAKGAYFCPDKGDLKYAIDAAIGTTGQNWESRLTLQAAIKKGLVYQVPDHTKVKVLETKTITLYSLKNRVVHVRIVGGESDGAEGWVQRDDVIDTPLQQLYQSMRGTSEIKRARAAERSGEGL